MLLLPLALLFAALGWWQVERMKAKQALISSFNNAEELPLEDAIKGQARFARVSATGRFDARRHILLDNQVLNGRAGVHVFTPFRTFKGTTILVNRGWKPMEPDRQSLPEVWTPAVPVNLKGILAPPPEHRQRLGAPDELTTDTWPQLVTYLEVERAAAALETPLPDWVVWLAAEHPAGFEGRNWSPSVMRPERHQAYAVQWFALAAAALAGWSVFAFRSSARRRGSASR